MSGGDWWDQFTGNLATDFAPLVALFGDSPTKQYLSECLTATDILIFATAPLGIITAIVSAIRVCGTPSLRAFIGRAQEGAGNAEAELCSSTSRDVCELYNNGGIARVFGRPKLLEIVHDPKAPLIDFLEQEGGKKPTAGIYSFKEYKNQRDNGPDPEWIEGTGKSTSGSQTDDDLSDKRNEESNFAPNPKLSLNVGIVPRNRSWFFAAAALGVFLQSAVLAWAVVARYKLHLIRKNVEDKYAIPLTVFGTISLDLGVGICAFLVERSTKERVFHRLPRQHDSDYSNSRSTDQPPKSSTTMYWVQPGNQIIGDQVFDSFAYTDLDSPLETYTTSWKQKEGEDNTNTKLIWTAVLAALVGFVLQFIGLRACHSSVSMAQLGATVVMSIVRASLRTQRMKKEANRATEVRLFQGHELDWLALEMSLPTKTSLDGLVELRPLWMLFNGKDGGVQDNMEGPVINEQQVNDSTVALQLGYYDGSGLTATGLCLIQRIGDKQEKYSRIPLISALQPSYHRRERIIDSEYEKEARFPISTRSFLHRTRLARMTGLDDTGLGGSSDWGQNLVSVRHTAQLLANAIEATATALFVVDTNPPLEFYEYWKDSFAIFCPVSVAFHGIDGSVRCQVIETSFFSLRREEEPTPEGPWQADKAELESILGLWTWSLRNRPEYLDHESKVRSTRLFKQSALDELDMWRRTEMKRIRTITLNLGSSRESYLKTPEPQGSLWWNDDMKFVTGRKTEDRAEMSPPPKEADDIRHFFGLQNLDNPEPPSAQINALELTSTNSLMRACAQELYQRFFDTIIRTIKHIGGQSQVKKGRESFYLANENIDRLYNAFTQSGLGSVEDAFACIIPVLQMQKKLPSVSNVLTEADAREVAARHIKEGDWIQASNILEWALLRSASAKDSSSEDLMAEVQNNRRLWFLTLCHCYHGSLKDERLRKSKFPYKRISSLIRSEYHRLAAERIPFLCVDRSIFPGSPADDASGTLAQALLSYTRATLWFAEDAQDTHGLGLIEAALAQCHILELYEWIRTDVSRPKSFLDAIRKGDLSSALYLLDRKDISDVLDGRTALSYAAERGWFIIVEALVNAKADVDAIDGLNRSSVYYATHSGDINTFRWLLSHGARPHIPDQHGRTALDCAADAGHLKMIQQLLADTRVGPNLKDESGQTALTRAVRRGASEVVNALLSSDRVYQTSQDKERLTDLMRAVDSDEIDELQNLLRENIVNTKAKDINGMTVLSRCAFHGQRRCFQYLLDFEPSLVEIRDNSGRSPLSLTAGVIEEGESGQDDGEQDESGQDDHAIPQPADDRMIVDAFQKNKYHFIIGELLRHPNVDPNERDGQGKTPLFHAVSAGNTAVVKHLLAKESVDPNLSDSNHESPLAIAIANRSHEIVAGLLASPKTKVSHINNLGDSSLSLAARLGYTPMVERLLDHNSILCQREEYVSGHDGSLQDGSSYVANFVNSGNIEGNTALMVAAQEGNDALVEMILSLEGINANTRNKNGDTPLIVATRNGPECIVEKLLQRDDIQVNVQNNLGKTALTEAVEHQRIFVVQNLLLHAELDANLQDAHGRTALHLAAVGHESAVLHLLLESDKVESKVEDETGNTPLLAAAQDNQYHKVMVLVERRKFDLRRCNHDGINLLFYAAANGWEDVVAMVLSQNWDSRNNLDKNGRDALSYATSSPHNPLKVVQRFIKKGFDPTRHDARGRTPIWYAAENDCAEILVYLLGITGVHVDRSDEMGRTLLSYQAGKNHVNVVKTLLPIEEVNPDSMDKSTATPLLYAILEAANEAGNLYSRAQWYRLPLPPWPSNMPNDAEVVELLLATGRVNPDRTFSEKRYLAIHFAAVLGYEKAVLALLPWVRPEERPAMRRFLAFTNMNQVWDSVASSQQWQSREEEPTSMNDTVSSTEQDPTSDLLKRDKRFTDLIQWAENVLQNAKPYDSFTGCQGSLHTP